LPKAITPDQQKLPVCDQLSEQLSGGDEVRQYLCKLARSDSGQRPEDGQSGSAGR